MHDNKEGYSYPIIDNNKCINCARCVRMCPSNNKFTKHPASFYMGWHKDDNVLLKSSSGGAITALAQITFARGGVVFGAYMDQKTHDITQVEIHNEEDLEKAAQSSADYVLLDSGKGSGQTFNWQMIQAMDRAFFLAGGLDETNIEQAIQTVHPYAIDISSGVETNRVKDANKIRMCVQKGRKL